jgi:hypothetical protein
VFRFYPQKNIQPEVASELPNLESQLMRLHELEYMAATAHAARHCRRRFPEHAQ